MSQPFPVKTQHNEVLQAPTAFPHTTEPLEMYRAGTIIIADLTTDTLALTGLLGDVPGSAAETDAIPVQDMDGVTQQGTGLSNGTYYFDCMFDYLKITKTGVADTPNITIFVRG